MDLDIQETLSQFGYSLQNCRGGWRTKALYREGNGPTSLFINNKGNFYDFVNGASGNLQSLIALSLKTTNEDINTYFETNGANFQMEREEEPPKIIAHPKYSKGLLSKLVQDNSYWLDRGINSNVLQFFRGGLAPPDKPGKLSGRFVFPVFGKNDDIIGFAGRDIYNNSDRPKWKFIGKTSEFLYPYNINHKIFHNKKTAILVESIGDCLSLFEGSICNVIVCFGLEVSSKAIQLLLNLDLNKIIVAFNNDKDSDVNRGLQGANKAVEKLSKYFNQDMLEIRLPETCNDWNECLLKYGKNQIRKELLDV